MPKENKTKYAVLGLLSRVPLSGYDIKKIIDLSISYFWNENFGHLYTVLRQMERESLISRQVMHTSGRPDRSVFSITDKGKEVLVDWLGREPETPPTRIELLLQLFFAGSLPLPVVLEKIQKEKEKSEARLAVYETIRRHIVEQDTGSNRERAPFWLITLSFGLHREQATMAWCDETMETLTRLQATRETGASEP
jgi:DNA-binding PadR family transcriptional regulator